MYIYFSTVTIVMMSADPVKSMSIMIFHLNSEINEILANCNVCSLDELKSYNPKKNHEIILLEFLYGFVGKLKQETLTLVNENFLNCYDK